MGVPRLFKYVCERFGKYISRFQETTHQRKVDNLYLDANAIIHRAAQEVFNYGQYKSLLNEKDDLTIEEKRIKTFEVFFDHVRRIVSVMTPTKLLYLAIDGVAPLGKQAQQRQRRYVAAKTTEPGAFNSSEITCGTTFMLNLTQYLMYAIRTEKITNRLWKFKVIFSPQSVPGEGEHKITNYIRSLPNGDELSHCMYGPDGDLIMLTLGCWWCPKFWLLREDAWNIGRACLLNVGGMRVSLANHLSPRSRMSDVINDFVLVCFLVGNDFLPKIQMFYLLEDGVDTILKVYSRIIKKSGTLTRNGKLNMRAFIAFIKGVTDNEKDLLQAQLSIRHRDPMFVNKTLTSSSSVIVEGTKSKKVLNFKLYREKYYLEKCGLSNLEEDVTEMCKTYMDGMDWVFKYYVSGCPSFRWYYPYHYAPLFTDFKKYLLLPRGKSWKTPVYSKEHLIPSAPFQQLLSVLPPRSFNLIPLIYRKLTRKEELKGYYPDDFEIDYEGKHREFEGIALLPFVDFEVMNRAYRTVRSKIKYTRNELGNDYLFIKIKRRFTFKSKFGEIKGCNISATKI